MLKNTDLSSVKILLTLVIALFEGAVFEFGTPTNDIDNYVDGNKFSTTSGSTNPKHYISRN